MSLHQMREAAAERQAGRPDCNESTRGKQKSLILGASLSPTTRLLRLSQP